MHLNDADDAEIINDIDDINDAIIVNQQINHDDDDDEDNEKIVIAMEELSISTMQTSNNDITEDSMNNTVYTYKSEDDDHFQENLKTLDQKIFNVKQMLESMKSTEKAGQI